MDQGRGPVTPHSPRQMNVCAAPIGASRAHLCDIPRIINCKYTYGEYPIADATDIVSDETRRDDPSRSGKT